DSPVIWRGPMKMSAVRQFLGQTIWGDLDYLICDLLPGTSDETLDILQLIPKENVIVVSTPQEVALMDARKTIKMAQITGESEFSMRKAILITLIFKGPLTGWNFSSIGSTRGFIFGLIPNILFTLGPVISTSSNPTLNPMLAKLIAKFTATVVFPTPPLPEITTILCLIFSIFFWIFTINLSTISCFSCFPDSFKSISGVFSF
ncbi:unnamed protein product, partial [marine sediment metagenome]